METINLAVLEREVVPTSDDHVAPVVVVENAGSDSVTTARPATQKTGKLRENAASGRIHAAVTATFSLPSEIAFRTQGAPVTPKRVEQHLNYWINLGMLYKTDGAGRYALKD